MEMFYLQIELYILLLKTEGIVMTEQYLNGEIIFTSLSLAIIAIVAWLKVRKERKG